MRVCPAADERPAVGRALVARRWKSFLEEDMNTMTEDLKYSYAEGDLLEDRHTYQYSRYGGLPFLHSWRAHRDAVLTDLGDPSAPPLPGETYAPAHPPFRTARRLEQLLDGWQSGRQTETAFREEMKDWVKKFEVSKRLFPEYNERFRTKDKTAYHEMVLYVRYAELMETAYRASNELPFLNVLLKVLDTLVARRDRLQSDEPARLAWLIRAEAGHVEALARKWGVAV